MSINLRLSMVVTSFALSVGAGDTCMAAGDRMTEPVGAVTIGPPRSEQATALIERPIPQAPIGHRQPRGGDVLKDVQLSPQDLEFRKIDQEIDRKIIICRGC